MKQIVETQGRPQHLSRAIPVALCEMKLSKHRSDTFVTYSLGSCVGLTLHDPVVGVGAMMRCMLPSSSADEDRAGIKPFMFVDTGIAAVLGQLYAAGAERQNLIVKVAGAGSPMGRQDPFRIGERNMAAVRNALDNENVLIASEDIGGARSLTMVFTMEDGRTTLLFEGQEVDL